MEPNAAPNSSTIEVERQKVIMPVSDLAKIFRSKGELYRFLTVEGKYVSFQALILNLGQYYLPPIQEVNLDYLRDVMAGRKMVIFSFYSAFKLTLI
jgi:hypothetical protein